VKVLVTGGAGFIGSNLTDRLLERSDEVLVIDNYATGRRDNLPESAAGLRVIEGDIADVSTVDDAFDTFGPDVVVHAAASYKDPEDWATDASTNVVGSANVVKAAQRADVRRLIYLQTALCYGLHPLEQPITLDHPLRPGASSYAISKTAGEHYVALSGLDWVSFRLANANGPRNNSGPLPTL
jgi:UDP-glucose 4-epimerase